MAQINRVLYKYQVVILFRYRYKIPRYFVASYEVVMKTHWRQRHCSPPPHWHIRAVSTELLIGYTYVEYRLIMNIVNIIVILLIARKYELIQAPFEISASVPRLSLAHSIAQYGTVQYSRSVGFCSSLAFKWYLILVIYPASLPPLPCGG